MSVDATSAAVRHRLKQHLFLIGFMGSGKSTVASSPQHSVYPRWTAMLALNKSSAAASPTFFRAKASRPSATGRPNFYENSAGRVPV